MRSGIICSTVNIDRADTKPYIGTSVRAFSIADGRLDVVIPQRGETWPIGTTQTIQWTTLGQATTGNIRIQLDNALPLETWPASPVGLIVHDPTYGTSDLNLSGGIRPGSRRHRK